VIRELRSRQAFIKPSVRRREENKEGYVCSEDAGKRRVILAGNIFFASHLNKVLHEP